MQSKLTDSQLQRAIVAKRRSEWLVGFLRKHDSEAYETILEVDQAVAQMICHCTSDGKPWQEPVDEPIATPFEECKCDMRTRLVGDGCEVCNPELAKELSRPDSGVHEQCKQPVPSRPAQITPIVP